MFLPFTNGLKDAGTVSLANVSFTIGSVEKAFVAWWVVGVNVVPVLEATDLNGAVLRKPLASLNGSVAAGMRNVRMMKINESV